MMMKRIQTFSSLWSCLDVIIHGLSTSFASYGSVIRKPERLMPYYLISGLAWVVS
jgi:hypothetical protein